MSLTANPNRHYYASRRSPILGIVLHVTAGLEDFTPPDNGAEATMKYGQTTSRAASWHGIVDSDSIIDALPDSYTAFHVIGYNSSTLGLEIANRNAVWKGKPAWWVQATLRNAATWSAARVSKYGLPIKLSTKAQVDAAIRAGRPFGFTYHRYLDPARRIDPGFDFPWDQFAEYVRAGGGPTKVVHPGVLVVDGVVGAATKNALAVTAGLDQYGTEADLWKAVQRWAGLTGSAVDGIPGPQTYSAVAARVGSKSGKYDTIWKAFQRWWNRDVAAGPLAASTARPPVAPTPAPAPAEAPKLRVKGPFPLPRGHWYGPEDADPRVHSGFWVKDRTGIRQIQSEVGAKVDGRYGPDTRAKVKSWQAKHGLTADGLAGAATWSALLTN